MGDLSYEQVDQLEKNLNLDWYKNSYLYKESLARLLTDSLRNNIYLADQIQKSCTESRMAFNTVSDLEKKIEKLEGNIQFLLGNNRQKGVPIGRASY